MLWLNPNRIALALLAGLLCCGCQPGGSGAMDEEKEPQFLIGRSRVNAMNFNGAIEAFEQALQMNPHSAAAHFELGWLYAEKEANPAAAIYHYQKYLQLRPTADNAETIQSHIMRLKQELAKAALPIPPSTEIQRQLEYLTAENRRLQGEVDQLQKALAQTQPANSGRTMQPLVLPRNRTVTPAATNVAAQAMANLSPRMAASPLEPVQRSHKVQAGETAASIARRYNLSVDSLLSANPGLNPRRIQVGQILKLPRR
ncbi:MAG: LysM peptidoglycan-binding domain-containing protein [Verrucomicrobiota bacterium]